MKILIPLTVAVLLSSCQRDGDGKTVNARKVNSVSKVPEKSSEPPRFVDFPADQRKYFLAEQDNFDLTRKIHAHISAHKDAGQPEAYEVLEGDLETPINMIPLKGGEYEASSGATTSLSPFWIADVEVTNELYGQYMEASYSSQASWSRRKSKGQLDSLVSGPTEIWRGFQHGRDLDMPTSALSHYAASKFCQWLSAKTGHFYRLPTETEWEYACRAGSSTATPKYQEADAKVPIAWCEENCQFSLQKGRLTRSNAFGLYDMLGGAAEWCVDHAGGKFNDGAKDPVHIGSGRFGHVICGGSILDPLKKLSAESRAVSALDKSNDPQEPRGVWFYDSDTPIGFRIVRPVIVPSAEEMHRFWNGDLLKSVEK